MREAFNFKANYLNRILRNFVIIGLIITLIFLRNINNSLGLMFSSYKKYGIILRYMLLLVVVLDYRTISYLRFHSKNKI